MTGNDVNDLDISAARAIVDFTPTENFLLRASVDSIDFDFSSFYDEPGLVVPIVDFTQEKTFDDVSWRGAQLSGR